MTRRLARSAGLIGSATLASRLLGLVRTWAIARYFGATDAVDAYSVAVRLPMLLRELFAEGAMSAAFVPTFKRHLTKHGEAAAWRLGSQVVNALLLVTGAIVVLGIVFAAPLVELYAAGFADTPGKLEQTVQLTRITMPFLTLIALAAAFMGMLNALRRFFLPALSPALFNVGLILGAVSSSWVAMQFGVAPIVALAIGFLLGGLGQMAIQYPSLRRAGYRHVWTLNFRDPGLREVLALMGPGTIGQAAAQINLLVNTVLATSLGTGRVTWLTYAFQFMYLPIGIFAVSVSTASIPDLAEHAAHQAWDQMRRVISSALRLMLMLSVPSCIGLMVIGAPIIELTLEYGAFDASDTAAVAAALFAYAPGLLGYSIVKIASPSFYAMQDARTPVTVSVVTVVSNVILNLTLVQYFGYLGLAAGTAIASLLNAGVLLYLLSRRIGGIDGRRVARAALKILVASMAMGVATWWVESWLHDLWPAADVASRAIRVVGAMAAGIGVLGLAAFALRLEEFRQVTTRLLRRLRG